MKLLAIFIVLNIVNVILQTVKSICTIKCGTTLAATANAIAYGLYTIVIIYTSCDLPLWEKVLVVALSNFIGVYAVKYIESKLDKDKLWKFEITIPDLIPDDVVNSYLNTNQIRHTSLIKLDDKTILNCYCYTQDESKRVIEFAKRHGLRFFASESKITIPY